MTGLYSLELNGIRHSAAQVAAPNAGYKNHELPMTLAIQMQIATSLDSTSICMHPNREPERVVAAGDGGGQVS